MKNFYRLSSFFSGRKIITALCISGGLTLHAQNVSVNTDGSSGPGLFNVGNTSTPPFQVMPNGQVLGWASGTAGLPAFSFVGNNNLGLFRPGTDILALSTAGTERIRIAPNGNISIGMPGTNAGYNLELGGSFGYGNGTAGTYRSRTETRNDAGQIASQSGFFETSAPSPASNWYNGANNWQHLLDIRHSNNSNNFAMQFAGSFFDQRLYFRKTNGSASQAWSEVVTVPSGNTASVNNAWNINSNIAYSPDDFPGTSVLSGDDVTANYTMPFSLTIDGTAYNTITISSNGWISFLNPGGSYTGNTTLPSSLFTGPTIFPYWDDLVTNGSNIRYFSTGNAPNRAVVVDYECRTYSGSYNVRFQVTIHEGSGLINVQYRDEMHHLANGQSATIGFQLGGGANAKAYPIISDGKILDDNRDNNSGWSVSPVR